MCLVWSMGKINTLPAWPPQLVLDIALETHDLPDLLHKYDISEAALDKFYENAQFRRELLNARAELAQSGSAFRAHARVMAEEHLMTMNQLMVDPETPVSMKVAIWQSLVKYASLEPPKESPVAPGQGAITINIAGYAAAPPAIDVTPSQTLSVAVR